MGKKKKKKKKTRNRKVNMILKFLSVLADPPNIVFKLGFTVLK